MTRFFLLSVFLWAAACSFSARAQTPEFFWPEDGEVSVCPVAAPSEPVPDFDGAACETVPLYELDIQGRAIWIEARFSLDRPHGANGEPLAVLLSGKFSSEVYLNGDAVGANGAPGMDKATETPGRMDAVVFLPPGLLRAGENVLVLKASSYHGALRLAHPIHWLGLAPAERPQNGFLVHYWPSLPTLGLFALAAIYFAVSGFLGRSRAANFSLFVLCCFAALQLVAEVSRGLVAYPYHLHDWRLIVIAVFSAGIGVTLSFLVATIFAPARVAAFTLGAGLLSLIGALSMSGFDQKAAAAMLAPMVLSVALLCVRSFKGNRRAHVYAMITGVFIAANLVFHSDFLDVVFFYVMALFLVGLMAEQAVNAARDERARREAETRAGQLALALEQAQKGDRSFQLSIKSAGRIETIGSDQIIQIKSVGGYVSILTDDGRDLLHTQTLADLEAMAPATFVRVHRSHLVNARYIRTLKRNPQGNGTLTLSDGSEVPVSRRIMPSLRQVLTTAPA
ncbi:MAG: LytTR family transcriptional regulator DNA-binding domain-containing protein [Pseudomonadota bacterium]